MVQVSINTLVTSKYSDVCGLNDEWRRNFVQVRESHIVARPWRSGRPCFYPFGRRTTSFGRTLGMLQPTSLRVRAGWLFRGNDKESELDQSCEYSNSVNNDILMFIVELGFATRVQCALNLEQYDIAQELRNKLTEIESEVINVRESRRGSVSKSEAQDMAISILRLRAELQKSIESENYSLAAELRDEISKLEAKSFAASMKAQAYENAQYSFRLGQRVKHKMFGYSGVICGMDPVCCESKSWMDGANVDKLTRGPDQPFYQVLIDRHDTVAYVPEENLVAVKKGDTDRFDHLYAQFLFYGMDAAGDYIPVKKLREKYNQPRHELPYDEEGRRDA